MKPEIGNVIEMMCNDGVDRTGVVIDIVGEQYRVQMPSGTIWRARDSTVIRIVSHLKVNPNVKVFIKAKQTGNLGFEDTPLFKKETQTNLF